MAGRTRMIRTVAKCTQPVSRMDKSRCMRMVFSALIGQDLVEETALILGGTTIKAHHAVTNGLGNPLRFLLSNENRNDIYMAQSLLEPLGLKDRLILANKGYDGDKLIRWVEERGEITAIPSRINAKASQTYRLAYIPGAASCGKFVP